MDAKTLVLAIVAILAIMTLTLFAPTGSNAPVVTAVVGACAALLGILVPMLKQVMDGLAETKAVLKAAAVARDEQAVKMDAVATDVAAAKQTILKVQVQTDGMHSELIKVTERAGKAEGREEGRAEELARVETTERPTMSEEQAVTDASNPLPPVA